MLFSFKRKDIVYAKKCNNNDGDLVEVTVNSKKNKEVKIKENQWYVIEGDVKKIVSDLYFREHYEPATSESSLYLKNPKMSISGLI